jgi:hypothetical protein
MTDVSDPLGRIAEHAAHPYDHPAVSEEAMAAYWRRLYANEAGKIPDDDLAIEHQWAVGAVAECEAALEAANERRNRYSWGGTGSWDEDNERIAAAGERDVLRHRLVRLKGRRDALAADAKRRRS